MRIETTESKQGKTVYLAKMGYSEVEMLHDLLREAMTRMPKIFELAPARARMNDMIEKLGQVVAEKKAHSPGYHVEDYVRKGSLLKKLGIKL